MPSGASQGLLGASWDFLGPLEASRGLPFSWGLLGFPGHPRIPEPLRRLREDPWGPQEIAGFYEGFRGMPGLSGASCVLHGLLLGLLGPPGASWASPGDSQRPGSLQGVSHQYPWVFYCCFSEAPGSPGGLPRFRKVPGGPQEASGGPKSIMLINSAA